MIGIKMDYSKIFNIYYSICFFVFLGVLLWTVYMWLRKEPFGSNKNTKNDRIKAYRVLLLAIVIFDLWLIIIPAIKDIHIHNNGEYEVDKGTVYQEIIRKGAFGIHRSIIVTVDGKEYRYQVIYADKNIKKGDEVQVTYLPHTTWSVVEKVDKED